MSRRTKKTICLLLTIMIAGVPLFNAFAAEEGELNNADINTQIVTDENVDAATDIPSAEPTEEQEIVPVEENDVIVYDEAMINENGGEEAILSGENDEIATLADVDYNIIKEKPYNLKLGMESSQVDIDKSACYTEGAHYDATISTKFGNPSGSVSSAKYGDGLVINFYNGYRSPEEKSDRYGSVCTAALTAIDATLYKSSAGSVVKDRIDNAIYGTNKLGFWAKVEKKDEYDRGVTSGKSTFSMALLCKNATYSMNVTINDNEQWQYVVVNLNANNNYDGFYAIRFTSDADSNFFGAKPQAESFGNVWSSALIIDEMTFYRGTSSVRTITMPSDSDEYEYFNNSNLKSVYIGDNKVFDSEINDVNNIVLSVPMNFDLAADESKIRVVPECEDYNGSALDNTRPIISGAVGSVLSMPAAEGEKGTLLVKAASGKSTTYDFTVKYDNMMVAEPYNGNFDSVANGLRTVKFTNYSAENQPVTVLCVVKDKTTNEMVTILTATDTIPAIGSKNVNFRLRGLPDGLDNYVIKVYFVDSVDEMNKVASTITIG